MLSNKFINAVSVITLVILIPQVVASAIAFGFGELTFKEYAGEWRDVLLLLIGFWIRGATSETSQES